MSFTGMWALDPVDGTKGFLRGGQFAVCLALIVDSKVVVGVIGCPNLLADPGDESSGNGVIFSAVIGEGAFSVCVLLLSVLEVFANSYSDRLHHQLTRPCPST
jgi:3'-phosphoadenosine 5'-phosphosulfate (PAPS) 3'-phosphatase